MDLKWVTEVPPRSGGNRASRWMTVVDELLKNPDKPAVVYEGNSSQAAETARNTLVSHIKSRDVPVQTFVRQNVVYAVATKSKKKKED